MSQRPISYPRIALATAGGHLTLLFSTLLFGILALAVGWLPPRGSWFSRLARWWSRSLLWGGGIGLERCFEVPLDGEHRYVVMSNHQGAYDIPALLATLPFPTRFLAKRSLFRVPLLGWAIRLGGFVPVDRGDRTRARQAFGSALEALAEGASVLVFPEETRSPDGRLLPFRRGGFLLAIKSGLPILPVGVRGTREICPKGQLTVRPGTVRVSYGKPIEVSDFGLRGRSELETEVRRRILELAGVEDSSPPSMAVDRGPQAKAE